MSDLTGERIPVNDLYRLLLQQLPNTAVIVFSKDLRCLTAQGGFLETTGIGSDQLIGKTLLALYPDAPEQLITGYQAALEGVISELEVTYHQSVFRARIIPIKNDRNEIIAGMLTAEDITAQKRTELALRQIESHYRLLAENSSDLIVQINLAGKYVYVSPSSQRVLGYTSDDMLGKTSMDFIHPDDASLTPDPHHAASSDATLAAPIRFRHKDGHYVWIEWSGKALYATDTDALLGSVATYRDVTARHQTEEKLRESEAQLQLLFENSLDGIVLGDREANVIRANPAACKMFGRSESELRTSVTLADLLDLSDIRYLDLFQTVLQTGRGRGELTGRRRDGTPFPLESSSTMLNQDPSAAQSWTIMRDMSARKLYQEALVEREKLHTALEKETELSRLKSRMMERVAHEFRTPFAVILVTIELITKYLDHLNPAQVKERVKTIHAQIQRLTTMLGEIDLAIRGQLVPDSLQSVSIDLSALCREIAGELETQFAGTGKYRLDLPASLPVAGDPLVFRNIFLHVLRNAAQFSASSSDVQVGLVLHGDRVELRVTDTGIGILENEQARIFESFFRGSNIGEIRGLGLGLTIVRDCVSACRGEIHVTSVPNQGTVVYISIPRKTGS